ncbi:potassium-transporting ATPase subunit KdpC [Lichenicoccus roseus]|uniref:Potassium-transporting ATPase KdpC subunit n=1 Tax=Lichenicoccus roseus TaxID=2683649 RepID=A0A5R9J8P3_9PROT|nr:potassium-transporting ATPase subunit KdpC [Lichenicoccus roseus]TLU73965.1 potassium-transporting ATPase subunit KdpC [Lichenicoccus roseus]
MLEHLRPAVSLVALSTVVLGLACPLAFVAAGHVAPNRAEGSLVMRDGHAVGSALIGQNFASPRYIHGRPSAITGTDAKGATIPAPYDASTSLASNLAPTSKALHDRIATDLAALGKRGLGAGETAGGAVPVDAITASGSGLDADISPDYALMQARPVASARGIAEASVRDIIATETQPRTFGLFGEPHVNVLRVNLALDRLPPGAHRGTPGQVAGVVR